MTTLTENLTEEQVRILKEYYLPNPAVIGSTKILYKELLSGRKPLLSLETIDALVTLGVVYYYFEKERQRIFMGVREEAYTDVWASDTTNIAPGNFLPTLTGDNGPLFTNQALNKKIRAFLSRETVIEPRMLIFTNPQNPFYEDVNMILVCIDCSDVILSTL